MPTRTMRTHHTRTTSGDWDGSEAEARLPDDADAKKYRQVYAWFDAGEKQSKKTAYKFPHHEVTRRGGVGPANERACISGIGILNGGRGGADIPAADRKKVYNHLAAHLRDAGREPPDLKRP
jgi:uncharacterized protein